jgi:hypothetical protein
MRTEFGPGIEYIVCNWVKELLILANDDHDLFVCV